MAIHPLVVAIQALTLLRGGLRLTPTHLIIQLLLSNMLSGFGITTPNKLSMRTTRTKRPSKKLGMVPNLEMASRLGGKNTKRTLPQPRLAPLSFWSANGFRNLPSLYPLPFTQRLKVLLLCVVVTDDV